MFAVFLDEGGEILDGAVAVVFDGAVLGAGREESDGRETLDFAGNIIGSGIDFSDGHFGGVGGIGAV